MNAALTFLNENPTLAWIVVGAALLDAVNLTVLAVVALVKVIKHLP